MKDGNLVFEAWMTKHAHMIVVKATLMNGQHIEIMGLDPDEVDICVETVVDTMKNQDPKKFGQYVEELRADIEE